MPDFMASLALAYDAATGVTQQLPQVAIEHGRKSIPAHDRPSIDEVENETLNGGAAANAG